MSSAATHGFPTGVRTWPWHPFLFGLGWVMTTYVAAGPHILVVARVVGVLLLLLSVLVMLLRLPTRSWEISGVVVTVMLAIAIAPGPVASLYVLVGALVATAMYLVAIRRGPRPPRVADISEGLNVIGGIFLMLTVVPGVANGSLPAAAGDVISAIVGRPEAPAGSPHPDVYIVVLDGYPRADTIRNRLGGSNDGFLSELEQRDFTVASASTSGYMYTYLALTSMLHGRHLVDIPGLSGLVDGAELPARDRQVLNQAPMLALFRDRGYVTIANAQAWDEPSLRDVDVYVDGSGLNEFERYMVRNSLVGSVCEVIDRGLEASLLAPWVGDGLAFLATSSELEMSSPRLVFAHIPSPHFPIIFEADGGRADARFAKRHPDEVNASDAAVTAAYLAQVEFLNRHLVEAIDAMRLPEDAVVILMSDHGPEFGLEWSDEDRTEFDVRFASFFAARNADGVFRDDVFVTEVLATLAHHVLAEPTVGLDRRFFSSDGDEKIATLTEVADPWR